MKKTVPWWACQYPFKPDERRPTVLRADDSLARTYGRGSDRIPTRLHLSTELLTCTQFALMPGSVINPPDIHSGDEVYFVTRGTLTIFNPDTGQTFVARPHCAFWIPWGTWHTTCNLGPGPAEALSFFSPEIWSRDDRGTDIRYDNTPKTIDLSQPMPSELPPTVLPTPTGCLGAHPISGPQGRSEKQMMVVHVDHAVPLVVGKDHYLLYRFLISNDLIHVALTDVPVGHQSDVELHGGDEILCVLRGVISVLIGDVQTNSVTNERLEARAGEKIYLPGNTPHWYCNFGYESVLMLKVVAPSFFCKNE